jgi:predicted DNA-binding transcriptional regulator YafY
MSFAKAEQLLRLATLVASRRMGVTLDDVAQEFRASHRTLQRMMKSLERHFPDTAWAFDEEGRKRWKLQSGQLRDFLNLNADEVAAVDFAVKALASSGDNVEAARLRSLRDKILALVPRQQAVRLETDHEALLEAQGLAARPGPRVPIDPEIARSIAETIKAGRVLEIVYRSRGERRARRRELGPYGVLSGFKKYLVAAPIGSDGVEPRTYRFEAIRSARMTDKAFQRPTNFDLQRYANRAFGSYHDPAQYEEVEWRFTPRAAEYALSFRFHPEQRVERCPDGSVIVRFTASGYLEMCWHLYAWGHDVEVIAPEALRVMCEQHRRSDFSALP